MPDDKSEIPSKRGASPFLLDPLSFENSANQQTSTIDSNRLGKMPPKLRRKRMKSGCEAR